LLNLRGPSRNQQALACVQLDAAILRLRNMTDADQQAPRCWHAGELCLYLHEKRDALLGEVQQDAETA